MSDIDEVDEEFYNKWVNDLNLKLVSYNDNYQKYAELVLEFEDSVDIDDGTYRKFNSYIFDKYIELVESDDQIIAFKNNDLNQIYIKSLIFPFELITNESWIIRIIRAHFVSLLGVYPTIIYELNNLKVMFRLINEYVSIEDNLQLMIELLKYYGKFKYTYLSIKPNTYIFSDNPNIKVTKSGLIDTTIYNKLNKFINYCGCGKWLAICYVCGEWHKYMYNNGDLILCDRPECYHQVGYIDYSMSLADKPCYTGGCDPRYCSAYLAKD